MRRSAIKDGRIADQNGTGRSPWRGQTPWSDPSMTAAGDRSAKLASRRKAFTFSDRSIAARLMRLVKISIVRS